MLARLFVPRVLARVVAELLMVRWAQQVTRSYLGLGLVEGWLGAEGVVKPSTLVEGTLGVKGAVEESSGAKGILELLGTYMSRVMAQTMFGWHYGASHAPERVGILGCGVSVVVMVVFILVRLAVGEYLGEMLAMMVVLRAVAWEYWGGWKLAGATVVLSWLIVREQVGTRVGGMTWWMIMFEGVFGVFLTRALVLYIWA